MALAPTDVASIEESTAIRLVTAHRCGDRDAFDEIVRSHYPSLLATARHRLGNPEDAKDAVQETLLRALLALDRFGDTGDWRLGAWLNTILIHVCADIPMRRRPTAPLSDWLVESLPNEAEDLTSDYVALAAVKRAIDELPTSQRRAFELRLVDDRPYDEVAGVLGTTEANARQHVKRARTALQNTLKSSDAVKGAWATAPLLITSPFRAALRRIFAGARDTANMAGSQAAASASATSGSSAGSAIAGMPVQTGIQLITQVSSTPLGQAVMASATGVPGKGSVVAGIVASLVTAGGVAGPVIAGSTPSSAPPPHVVAAASPATSKFAPPAAPSSGAQGNSVSAGSSPSASVPINHTTAAPTWVTLAMSAATYTVVAPTPSTSSASGVSGTTAPAPGSPATSTGSGAGTSVAPPPAGAGQPAAGSTTTAKTAPTSSTTSSASHALTLPIGTCTGVTGFPGVTAPTSVPPLASSVLDAVLSTGALSLGTVSGSPAFGGTALVKATSGSTAPVNVKVGTCLAAGGSILAVDLTGSTGDEVQLVGSLVAQPVSAATGSDTYLFRGNVTQVGGTSVLGAGLPWGLPQGFVAEVQVQTTAKTGALTVVFVQPENQTGPSAATPGTSTSATTAGGATSTATSTATSAGTTSSDATTTSATRPSGPLVVGGGSSKTT